MIVCWGSMITYEKSTMCDRVRSDLIGQINKALDQVRTICHECVVVVGLAIVANVVSFKTVIVFFVFYGFSFEIINYLI